ncbi:hypothetical protein [Candidatus Erwinia dacicola]|uniref:Uncharacterized protein n=1 Tax=Candidatus Erwinia dacicola TaxID=252393 RepID=A0A328THA2_9GAMM|nr:hypothetical protein [Candidatus Erwinia dacicola]RAP69987.1 hypothetical protein ACZ87_03217 [Candidatus Erwinia dacicola]
MLKFDRSLKEASSFLVLAKNAAKQAILIGLLLDFGVIKSLILIEDFVKLAYASCKKTPLRALF